MLEILVLGTAAGGGLPQWNCACENCQLARRGALAPRGQSGIAISANGSGWHLVNASPDITRQLEEFLIPRLAIAKARFNPIENVFLTNADLDHTLGLLHLREGTALTIRCPDSVRSSLERGMRMDRMLTSFAGVHWISTTGEWQSLEGFEFRAVPLRGTEPPRFDRQNRAEPHAVGYLFREAEGAPIAGVFPDVAVLDDELMEVLQMCARIWFDGTFWSDDELLGLTGRTATQMGHVPISGAQGSLAALASLGSGRVSYLHINNTNPILRADSAERCQVEAAGLGIAEDGDHCQL